jgi:Protein of unknown function (DUF2793)
MTDVTARLALPLLAAGQAQKEVTHNEALTVLDGLLLGALESRALASSPANPVPGQMWLVAGAATGAWAGQSGKLALWTAGGWRFVTPVAGMLLWSKPDLAFGWHDGSAWHWGDWPVTSVTVAGQKVVGAARPAIPAPTGGTVTDSQARTSISAILQALRDHGLILT